MKYHMLLVANRRYHLDAMVEGQIAHLEDVAIGLGNQLQPGEWIEFETNPYPAYLVSHAVPRIRPRGALPNKVTLSGMPITVTNRDDPNKKLLLTVS